MAGSVNRASETSTGKGAIVGVQEGERKRRSIYSRPTSVPELQLEEIGAEDGDILDGRTW